MHVLCQIQDGHQRSPEHLHKMKPYKKHDELIVMSWLMQLIYIQSTLLYHCLHGSARQVVIGHSRFKGEIQNTMSPGIGHRLMD